MTDPQATAQPTTRVTTGGLSWTCPWCKQRFPDTATSHTCEHVNLQPDRYEEGRQQGLREAAEIARAKHALHESRVCRATKPHMFDPGAEWAARYIAEAIEAAAKAGEKP